MSLCWEVMASIILGLVFLNIIAQNYFLFVAKERRRRSIPLALTTILVPVMLYTGFVCLQYFYYPGFNKTIVFEVTPANFFELSSAESISDTHFKKKLQMYHAQVSFMYCFFTPFVLLCKTAFAVFGGAGMALFPINMVYAFLHRPKQPDPEEHIFAKKVLRDTSEALINRGRQIYDIQRDIQMSTSEDPNELRTKKEVIKNRIYELKRDLIEFEEIYENFEEEDNFVESNPLIYIGYLILGILTGFISLLVIIHAIMTIAGIYGALEWIFLTTAKFNSIISMMLFVLFALYLCVAVVYGSITMTYLLSWVLNSHPVKPNGTWTDSFLVNINFSLFGTMGMILFMLTYCRSYFRFTTVDTLFNNIISRTQMVHFLRKGLIFGYIMMLFFLTAFFISFFLITSRANMTERVEIQKRVYKEDKEKLQAFESKEENASFV